MPRAIRVAAGIGALVALLATSTAMLAATNPHQIKDVYAGSTGSDPTWFTKLGSRVLFFARDATHGYELFRTDGTKAGTQLVRNIGPGTDDGTNVLLDQELFRFGSMVLFQGDDGTHGVELWRSDGTKAGTRMVADLNPGPNSSEPGGFLVVGSRVFFRAFDDAHGLELWVTDGTTAHTHRVADIRTGPDGSEPDQLTSFKNRVFFVADDGSGQELWKSNLGDNGAQMVKDINTHPFEDANVLRLTVMGKLMFFSADDGTNGPELWVTEGGRSNTTMLDLDPNIGSNPHYLVVDKGRLYFAARDTNHGEELWRTDGTILGTKLVKDAWPGMSDGDPDPVVRSGKNLFFAAHDPNHGQELWKTDGTRTGTKLVKDIDPGTDDGNPSYLTNVAGLLLFEATDGTHGYSLWRSDGTRDGTRMVKDITPGPGNFGFNGQLVIGRVMFIVGEDGTHGVELWRTNGTKAGTRLVADINPSGDSGPNWLANVNGTLYFAADDGSHGIEPWRYTP